LSIVFSDLGITPLANSFLESEKMIKDEEKFPLCAFICKKCLLVQLEEYETPKSIFSNYAYFSSFSETWLKHAKDYCEMIIKKIDLDKDSQVTEIASNDGYLLQFFREKKIPVLGIEPAENVAKESIKKKIPTIIEFFNLETSKDLIKKGKQSDLIIGNNVLAHVSNLNDFIKGLKNLLKKNGIITLEFPHILQLMKQNQFDTIYHEHFSYFSLLVAKKIFAFHGLIIFDVEELSTHGGSLRIYVKLVENHKFKITQNIEKVLEKEKEFGLDNIETYKKFGKKIESVKKDIKEFFNSAKKEDKKIVCYGASAKGNTLLNYCNVNPKDIEYVVDLSPHKQGLLLPGMHIQIQNTKKIIETKPDYLFLLIWNLKDEVMNQMSFIRDWGGKFVIPIPEVKIY